MPLISAEEARETGLTVPEIKFISDCPNCGTPKGRERNEYRKNIQTTEKRTSEI